MSCFRFHAVNIGLVRATLQATGVLPDDLFKDMPIVPVSDRVSVAVDDMMANHAQEVH